MRPSATAIVSLVLASQNTVFAAKIDDDNQYDKKNRKHNFYSFLKCTINYRIKQGNPRLIAGNHPKIGLIDQSFTDTFKHKAIKVLEIVGCAMDGTTAMQLHTGRE